MTARMSRYSFFYRRTGGYHIRGILPDHYGGSDREIFELTDTTNGRKVYCEPKGFIPDMNRDFVVLGYYEKMKKQYVGKSFIYRKY